MTSAIKAVIQNSTLYFLLGGTAEFVYGKVGIRTTHNGKGIEFDNASLKIASKFTDSTGGNVVKFYSPSFDVTADGTAIITYGRVLDSTNLKIAAAVIDQFMHVTKYDVFLPPVPAPPSSPGTPDPPPNPGPDPHAVDTDFDYTSASRDPLFPQWVWFAHHASSGKDKGNTAVGATNHWLGINAAP
jgi:hypothetical protein